MPFPLSDSRRQTGAGLFFDTPGAALEVAVPDDLHDRAEAAWRRAVAELAPGLWEAELAVRRFEGGLSLALSAPLDALYAATEWNEAAWKRAEAEIDRAEPPDLGAQRERIRSEVAAERYPALGALAEAADRHGVSLAWDDDAVTVGMGAGGISYAYDSLPDPADVPWADVRDVPAALITGTNGKSTTARILAGIAAAGGETVGLSTTDAVSVGGAVVERGDFSGPLGARAVVRDRRVTLAVCETARGGLLRRGVPLPRVTAAALTNVAADHLGDYGILTVPALADAKLVVARALGPGGVLVAPADEPEATAAVLRQRDGLRQRGVAVAWTALDDGADAELAATVRDGEVVLRGPGGWRSVCAVEEVPAALGGAARHVVRNALTAAALAQALGLSAEAIGAGLRAFRSDPDDNPGRANRFELKTGATAVVDYAHNAHGLRALVDLAGHWNAARRWVLFGSAGDRSDRDLEAMCDEIARLGAHRYVLVDIPGYLRGRQPGEVPALLAGSLQSRGVSADACLCLADPASGARHVLDHASSGDLALLLTLAQRDEVLAMVRAAETEPGGSGGTGHEARGRG